MAAAEWPTGRCRFFESHLVASQRRDRDGRWLHEETRICSCRHRHTPCSARDAAHKPGMFLRCDGYLERCEVPKQLFDDDGEA